MSELGDATRALWARRLGVNPAEVLDAYVDRRSDQVVIRLTGYRRLRRSLNDLRGRP